MAQVSKWEGIFPAVTTKFREDGSLDTAEMERCYRLNIEAGVEGLIVCGSLGEASTLDPDEKLAVLKVARSVAGQRPVMLTISDGSTRNAQRLAERGAAAGAAGFMVLPGLPYKSDPRETMAHYTAVARAGGLPVMIYNNPVAYGVDITPAMLVEMAAEPLFAAVKELSDDIRRVTDIVNLLGDRYQVFAGVDNLALESFAMGGVGWGRWRRSRFSQGERGDLAALQGWAVRGSARDLSLDAPHARYRRVGQARAEHQAGGSHRDWFQRPLPATAVAARRRGAGPHRTHRRGRDWRGQSFRPCARRRSNGLRTWTSTAYQSHHSH